MANDLTSNPIKVDTAMVTPIGRRDGGYSVSKIVWENHTLAADNLIITQGDGGDKVLFSTIGGTAAGSSQYDFVPPRKWANFEVGTLDSGIVWIFLEPRYNNR